MLRITSRLGESHRQRGWLKGVLIASGLSLSVIQASEKPTRHLPTQGLSVGQIALLVRQGGSAQVVETLQRGLRDERAEIRAAAGRVIYASGAAVPLDVVQSAMQVETDLSAAREEAGALVALGGPEVIAPLRELGTRLGARMPGVIALLLARASGPPGIEAYISELKGFAISAEQRAACILMATGRDAAALNSVGRSALGANDADTWLAVLDGASEAAVGIETSLLVSALKHSLPEIAAETAWRLARVFSTRPAGYAAVLREAVEGTSGNQNRATDVDLWFGMELLGRIVGSEVIENKLWIDHLRTAEASHMDSTDPTNRLVALLTPSERRALQERLAKRYPGWGLAEPGNDNATRGQRELAQLPKAPPPVRLASGFPPKFVSDTLTASGCTVPTTPLVGEATVTYDPLGRPRKIALVHVPPKRECAEAMTALFAASVAPLGKVTDPTTPETLILVLEKGYLSRLEEDLTQARSLSSMQKERIEPPTRRLFVKPEYPVEARRTRLHGKVVTEIVVNEAGLVSDMHLLKEADDDFVRSAFLAVAQWRYKPALLANTPVKVYLTVIVEWNFR